MRAAFASLLVLSVSISCAKQTEQDPPKLGTAPSTTPTVLTTADAGTADAATAPPGAPPPKMAMPWLSDDVPAAVAQAKREQKLVFVDAWAVWCHTCISMKHFVFTEPSLSPLGDLAVFVEVDTDRDQNAAFVDKYAIDVWPTFFVIEPESGEILGYWPGAASVKEMDAFVREAVSANDARRDKKLEPNSPLAQLLKAKDLQARSQYAKAIPFYQKALAKAPPDWPRRDETLRAYLSALFNAGKAEECVKVGQSHLDEIEGAAQPTDFARQMFDCASHLTNAAKKKDAEEKILATLERIVASPHPDASADDRADTLDAVADVYEELGKKSWAKGAHVKRLAILEDAAAKAPTPMAASAFDYARAGSYMQLGRADDAIKMLTEREKQIPDSYEPPARLAGVLNAMKRYPEALAAINRALEFAYGPRRVSYLGTKADILGALGDTKGQIAALEEQVAGYEAQAKRQTAKPERMATAKKRLEAAKKKLGLAKSKTP
jgi:tetratricopeptide (TPR) repeat protein